MALTPETDETFIREVDEDLRRDKLNKVWSQYGRTAIVAISIGLIGFGGYLYWKELKREEIARNASAYAAALGMLSKGETSKAIEALTALNANASGGYRALSALSLAGAQIEAGEVDKAVAGFKALSTDMKAPAVFRELAAFRAVSLTFDTMKPAEAEAALKPLAQEGKPFFAPAAELLAVSYLEQGKFAQAQPLLEAVAALESAPPSIRGRAANLLQLVPGANSPKPKPAAPAAKEPAQ